MLWRDSLIMYDRKSRSLWSQVNGESVAGTQRGNRLEKLSSELTSWAGWVKRHPETLVLVKPPLPGSSYAGYHSDTRQIGVVGTIRRDTRLPPKVLMFGIEHDDKFAAVSFEYLAENPTLNTDAVGTEVVIFSPPGEDSAHAFVRRADDRVLNFKFVTDGRTLMARDEETESIWSWEEGLAVEGPLKGIRLERIDGIPVYWAIWAKFHRKTEIIGR